MEVCLLGVLGNLFEELTNTLIFCLEDHIFSEAGVQIDVVKSFQARRVFDQAGISRQGVNVPWLTPNISRIEDGSIVVLEDWKLRYEGSLGTAEVAYET